MKKTIILSLLLLCTIMLWGINRAELNEANGKLINNKAHSLFYYDTTTDDISGTWKSNNSLSWYNEPANPSDDFMGSLDTNKWQQFDATVVDSGVVKFNGPILYGLWHGGEINSQNKWSFSEDFDIQINFNEFSSENNGELKFEIKGANNPDYFLFVSRAKKGYGSDVYLRNDYDNNYAETATSLNSGKLRIVRIGNNVTTYYGYWDAGSAIDQDRWKWSQLGSTTTFGNETVYVRIFSTGAADVNVSVTVDDFIALYTSGCDFGLLGSSTRSTKQEFPDRVLLVASEKGLDIIDAEDNSLWMRFNTYDRERDTANYQNIVADKIKFVYALNGKIYVGAPDGYMLGVGVIDFALDTAWFYDRHSGDGTGWNFLGNISQRNMHCGWTDNDASYVQLESDEPYDVDAKYISGNTYLAIANGKASSDNYGRMVTINIENNTKSFDVLGSTDEVIDIKISKNGDNYLYYLTNNRLFCSHTAWMGVGNIGGADRSVSTAPETNENSYKLAINQSYVFVGNEDLDSFHNNGSTTKRDLNTLGIVKIYDETDNLLGSANSKALYADDNNIWIGTDQDSYGKINVIDLTSPHLDETKGIFNTPDFLLSHRIKAISYCNDSNNEYIAVAYYDSVGISVLSSATNEISISNITEGEIQYCFTNGNPFEYNFENASITLDPSNSKAIYGNVNIILHNQQPSVPFPEHSLSKWFEIKEDPAFDAFPVDIEFNFTDPIPAGDNRKELFNSDDLGVSWTNAETDPQVSNIQWNYTTSPYFVKFTTSHFSYWGMSNGDGDDPLPVILSNFFADFSSETVTIQWTTQSESNILGWNILKSEFNDFQFAEIINPIIIDGEGSSTEICNYSFTDMTNTETDKIYYYWLESIEYDGTTYFYGHVSVYIPNNNDNIAEPSNFIGLSQNYPNPFNPNTQIMFCLDYNSQVKLLIYNLKGEIVRTLFDASVEKNGKTILNWDGTNNNGKKVVSGIYFYKLITSKDVYVRKMMILK